MKIEKKVNVLKTVTEDDETMYLVFITAHRMKVAFNIKEVAYLIQSHTKLALISSTPEGSFEPLSKSEMNELQKELQPLSQLLIRPLFIAGL